MRSIYLDHAATTPISDKALDAYTEASRFGWGNPSSQHRLGKIALTLLDQARMTFASSIGAKSSNIIFTSGGTESNNLAIHGAVRNYGRKKKHIVTSSLEHQAVKEVIVGLGSDYEITVVTPEPNGRISALKMISAFRDDTCFVSCILVCNETGAINPIAEISKITKRRGIVLHTDAVQALGHIPLDVNVIGADLMTFSGHKVGAPRGIGALYRADGIRLLPIILGGGQEEKQRAGTENVAGAFAFATAVQEFGVMDNLKKLYLIEKLELMNNIVVIPPHDAPHIVTMAVRGCPGEVVQRMLSDEGICVSTGSACAKGKKSEVLISMRLAPELLSSIIRVSFSKDTSFNKIDEFVSCLKQIIKRLTF